jgi:D-alanyl-D-alanine carboxypeptidase/D-alanyl-D-alanine-endopeptidase (penicillin-binding protein 4)
MSRWKNVLILVLALGWAGTAAILILRKPEIPEPVLAEIPAAPLPEAGTPESELPPLPAPEPVPEAIPEPAPEEAPSPVPAPSVPSGLTLRLSDLMANLRAAPDFKGVAIGLTVLDPEGTVAFSDGGDTAMIPASTLKTVTTATALEQLGVDFVFETTVRAAAKPDAEGTLAGDLILVGGGDPTLSTSDLKGLAKEVGASGVQKINGRVLADARIFPEQIASDFWNWGDIGNGYGSSAAGLNLNHNRFVALFAPGAIQGAPTQFLGAGVELPGVEWINRVTTGAPGSGDGVMLYTSPGSSAIFCFGTIPKDEQRFGVVGAVPDPARYTLQTFLGALRAQGITVTGKAEVIPATDATQPPAEVLATHRSAPLPVIVRHLLEVSDNHEAECLFRFLARKHGKPGEQVIREHWSARGLDFQGLRMVDGSGLARADFICPHDMARLLHLVRRGERGDVFFQSLNSHFGDRVRWKGGAMSSIRSWAGYVQRGGDPVGQEWTFALIFNHFGSAAATTEARDNLVRLLLKKE